ncbi:hypothetical protein [Marinilabilia rubra]|uniref:Uncharacterized protein n=1 Tax=Marinilabilia rubra TaxID=2162893 RepID=A0A2U2B615_9BACT|nr:hypothetical protein [Marinilabilia rubra]PWD98495.1 hypothetical protein DDZ16_15575 [Marinilabilia rubra]
MRFTKKPRYGRVITGLSIVLTALIATHTINVHFLWSAIFMGLGIVHFTTGFLIARKEHKRAGLITKRLFNK